MKEVQAEVGRRLREEYGTAHPLADHLADLLRKIEQSTRAMSRKPSCLMSCSQPAQSWPK
jgi:hypothetical protein